MPDTTANLSLPLILPAQAQKHVTHNEAIWRLDVLVQAAVEDRSRSQPPAAAAEGQRHLVGPAASGAWAGHDGEIAVFTGLGWDFLAPRPGWRLRVLDEALDLIFDSGSWQDGTVALLHASALGLNTSPDPANRLSVSADASLLTHQGAGHRLKVNKATPADTASLLFQTGFSGRAEMGLAGNDDFSIKISADGSSFAEALRIDRVSGRMTGAAIAQNASDTTTGRLLTVGAGYAQLDGNLYRRGNALGSVSHSTGVPTGALMERGANANGDYLRLADGTQICWAVKSTTTDANASWTFPAIFSATPVCQITPLGAGLTLTGGRHNSVNVFGLIYNIVSTAGARVAETAHLMAVGRWF